MWDAALFYPAGVEWGDTAPRTDRWSKQVMFFGSARPDGVTGTFWVDTLEPTLVDSDWFTEIRRITAGLPGKKSPDQTAAQVPSVGPPSAGLARPNCAAAPTAPVEVTSLAESLDSLKAHFNKANGRHRFVALLSPT